MHKHGTHKHTCIHIHALKQCCHKTLFKCELAKASNNTWNTWVLNIITCRNHSIWTSCTAWDLLERLGLKNNEHESYAEYVKAIGKILKHTKNVLRTMRMFTSQSFSMRRGTLARKKSSALAGQWGHVAEPRKGNESAHSMKGMHHRPDLREFNKRRLAPKTFLMHAHVSDHYSFESHLCTAQSYFIS